MQTERHLAKFIATFASLGAGVLHFAVTPDHWQEWITYGAFFLGIAIFQIIWAGLVVWFPRTGVVIVGLVANLGAIALWGASRTWGPPIGPAAGVPEAVGITGVLTVLLEAMVVVSLLWLLLARQQPAALSKGAYRAAVGGAVVVMAALTAPGVLAAMSGGHGHSHGEAEPGHGADGHGAPGHSDTPQPGTSAPREPSPDGVAPAPPAPGGGHGDHDH